MQYNCNCNNQPAFFLVSFERPPLCLKKLGVIDTGWHRTTICEVDVKPHILEINNV